jgi:glutathione S-transferase
MLGYNVKKAGRVNKKEQTDLTLVIGDKNLSSWSMRPWLVVKASGLKFKEIKVRLDKPKSKSDILRYSPSGRVPVLLHGRTRIWDSIAICEYLAELAPDARLYPNDQRTRAIARSYVAEMHSGFSSLRNQLSMDINLRVKIKDTVSDIQRIVNLWSDALTTHRGDFLFGNFGIADAFYAPVIMRFQSYGIEIADRRCRNYMQNVLKNQFVKEWVAGAKTEKPISIRFSVN